jgi:hypothetical protein
LIGRDFNQARTRTGKELFDLGDFHGCESGEGS